MSEFTAIDLFVFSCILKYLLYTLSFCHQSTLIRIIINIMGIVKQCERI